MGCAKRRTVASVVGQSDDELIAGVRGGDTAAFEEIYDRYARGILAFCAHMLGSREAAEDALQLTFVSAYRALRSGENSIALRPWLYTIARNRCLSELRARRDAIGVDELTSDHPVFEGLADQVQRREDLREMLDDMQRLPADQRAALVLFELGDHPQKDIASVLGVRTEKVKALVFQAREALVRGRQARQHPCGDIREQLATMEGRIPARSLLRAHIDRCAGCQSFEHEVRHQRAALAVILPVALAGELKASILGSALHSGAVAAACGGGGGAVAVSACGGSAVVGGATAVGGVSAIGGATAVSGVGGGLGAVSAATAGGLASAGAGAVATSAPVVAAATGLTAIGESIGVGGLSASGVVAKILTAAAIATVAASTGHSDRPSAHRATAPPTTRERLLASVPARSAPRAPAPFDHPPATARAGARNGQLHDAPCPAGTGLDHSDDLGWRDLDPDGQPRIGSHRRIDGPRRHARRHRCDVAARHDRPQREHRAVGNLVADHYRQRDDRADLDARLRSHRVRDVDGPRRVGAGRHRGRRPELHQHRQRIGAGRLDRRCELDRFGSLSPGDGLKRRGQRSGGHWQLLIGHGRRLRRGRRALDLRRRPVILVPVRCGRQRGAGERLPGGGRAGADRRDSRSRLTAGAQRARRRSPARDIRRLYLGGATAAAQGHAGDTRSGDKG